MRRTAAAILMLAMAGAARAEAPWVSPPTPAQLATAYPALALKSGVVGTAHLHCQTVLASGDLDSCTAVADPAGLGFAEAAVGLAQDFKVRTARGWFGNKPGGRFDATIRFVPPGGAPTGDAWRVTTQPEWLVRPTEDQIFRAYPPAAMARRVEGMVHIACTSAADGSLSGCAVKDETPTGQGFGPGALSLLPLFRIRPKTIDGTAVASPVIIPVRFAMGS